jgi:hypothetical protein
MLVPSRRNARLALGASLAILALAATPALAGDIVATVGGTRYVSHGLVAMGQLPASLRDSFGETFGSCSGMALVPGTWKKAGAGYEGALFLLPDRGYNVEGTTDYRVRFNKVEVKLTPVVAGAAGSEASLGLKLVETKLFQDAAGATMTGLDPEKVRAPAGNLPSLPEARTGHVSLDPEAMAILADGTILVSDEYGPNIYRFSAEGRMIGAVRPPAAFTPMRKGVENFSSNNPGPGAAVPEPKDPETGRQNNHGLEGMALTPDGKTMIAVLQSATRQDGGDAPATRYTSRALVYDITDPAAPKLKAEYAVPLPRIELKGKPAVAAQSEIVALSDSRILMLSRDSNSGYGLKGDTSVYRRIDIVDFSGATNIAGSKFDGAEPLAPKGKLDESVKPATLTAFIDINDNAELGRFGLHNGAPNAKTNLSEKWESMALASVLDPAAPDDYFLFVGNDNDFITQDGFQVGSAYKDASGADVDTRLLVYRVTLPGLGLK